MKKLFFNRVTGEMKLMDEDEVRKLNLQPEMKIVSAEFSIRFQTPLQEAKAEIENLTKEGYLIEGKTLSSVAVNGVIWSTLLVFMVKQGTWWTDPSGRPI